MNRILLVGGSGLIGKSIYNALSTLSVDLAVENDAMHNPDRVKEVIYGFSPDKIINAAYPKDSSDHANCFYYVSYIGCESMKSKGGVIVTLSSIYGIVGPQDDLYEGTDMCMPDWYAFIKGGIITHTRCLASRYGKYGVRVNCISPGGVFDNQPECFVDKYSARTPLKRMASAQDIVNAVMFLISDTSSYITGHNLVVDGGWTCR